MENENLLKNSMDDIVFDGRNKSYGAFQLRRLYDKHMSRAMISGMLFFLLAVSSPKIIQRCLQQMKANQTQHIAATPRVLLQL